jgi:hypothetical protein
MRVLRYHSVNRRRRLKVCFEKTLSKNSKFNVFLELSATHLNNGPSSEPSPAAQQQQQQQHQPSQQQQQAPPINNKRPAPSNPVSTIQVPPLENGLDYRGHHQMNSNQQPPISQAAQGSNIRFE